MLGDSRTCLNSLFSSCSWLSMQLHESVSILTLAVRNSGDRKGVSVISNAFDLVMLWADCNYIAFLPPWLIEINFPCFIYFPMI